MTSSKILQGLQIFALVCIAVLATTTVWQMSEAGVKAPLLTMMGGVTIITVLYPTRVVTMRDMVTLAGTGIVVFGDFYWLIDATENNNALLIEALTIFLLLILVLVGYVLLSMLVVLVDWHTVRDFLIRTIRKITRR